MSLVKHLEIIPDPRKDINLKHNLVDVIFLTLSAVLSGADGWKAIEEFGESQLDWLRQHRSFENGIPKRHCIASIIKSLDTEILLQTVFGWINQRRQSLGQSVIALDGKTMRGAWREDVSKALHVVSAFDVNSGIALYQDCSDNKGNERAVARNVIEALAMEDVIYTLDALHCQTDTMETIATAKSDFVIQLKADQSKLFEYVKESFTERYNDEALNTFTRSNQGHGRQESRTVMQMKAELPEELQTKWPHIRSIIEVASERQQGGQTSYHSRWYASSLTADAEQFATIIREHWSVENQLHWVLDVAFREDQLKISDPDGAAHIALFNRACLNLLKQHQGKKDSMAGKRRRAAWSGKFRTELLFG